MNCLEQINIGTLQTGVFPKDDGRTYIYKRPNGHIYTYTNGFENHVCCNDGQINSVPKFENFPNNVNPIHIPPNNFVYLFIKNNKLYGYDKDLNVINLTGAGTETVNWTVNEWD